MTLDDLPTPCLVLDLGILRRNLAAMRDAVARHPSLVLRPHLKTAKSREVAALAAPGFGPVTVSTLAEAAYFAEAGWRDQVYAVGITRQKLDAVAALNARYDADIKVITDDPAAASAIAAHPARLRALIEVDVGEARGGVPPDGASLPAIAAALGPRLAGLLSHSGHSYEGRSLEAMAAVAEQERQRILAAAARLRAAGHALPIVSVGSSPTALHARDMAGITEVRAGVYMFGDLFQAQLGTHAPQDIAVTVLASVIGRRPDRNTLLLDAGALALSKDRSTRAAPRDYGFGLVLDLDGRPLPGEPVVARAYQEHGEVHAATPLPFDRLPIGAKLRVAPNHTCLTAAAHAGYHLVDGGRAILGSWDRINHW